MAGIYIHIPFCKQKCYYCNFYSVTSLKYKSDFLKALLKEIELQKDYLEGDKIKTIYFGGGTPSLLSRDEIIMIIDKICKYHYVESDAEITLESNPDDLNKETIKGFKSTYINRLSIGVQSFFDEDLQYLNRIHNSKQAYRAIKLTQDAGFQNLSIDLIYGIPTLNAERWKSNLQTAFSLNIPHISAYSLTVEHRTLLAHLIRNAKLKGINEQQSIEHFKILLKLMKKNDYIHYEISNFSKPCFYSKHNSNYWLNEKYLGLGPSAHSFNIISRQWNIANIIKYIQSIKNNEIPFEKEILSKNQKYDEYILTSLRTIWGCDIKYIKKCFGEKYYNNCINQSKVYIIKGLLSNKKSKLFLTDKGKLFADKVAADLFMEVD